MKQRGTILRMMSLGLVTVLFFSSYSVAAEKKAVTNSIGMREAESSVMIEQNKKRALSIIWNNYDDAVSKISDKNKKKIYINFYGEGGFCTKMDKETFVDPKVVSYMKDNFIAIRVDMYNEEGSKLAHHLERKFNFRIKGVPDHVFLTEKWELIGNRPGGLDAGAFLEILSFIKNEKYKKKELKWTPQ